VIHNDAEIADFKKLGIHVIRRGDKNYPERLNNLIQPPEVLYCRGDLDLLSRPAIAIVGTRDSTRYGVDIAKRFAKVFAENGVVVISGLAEGIDTAAHLGAIEGGGAKSTIAVLGNGLNINYPTKNAKLQGEIAEKGLLVSEYLPNFNGTTWSFPARNRIVAALSSAVLIVEADIKSGTMITKDYALDLGLDVFAIPGSVVAPQSRGTNKLIRDGNAAMATEPMDVLNILGGYKARKIMKKPSAEPKSFVQISFDERRILDVLKRDEVHIDELVEKIDLPIQRLATILTEMEMKGILEKLPGNVFAANIG